MISTSPNSDSPAETTAETPPTVAPGLGFPNNREEISPTPTGWQASRVLADGLPDQLFADVESIEG